MKKPKWTIVYNITCENWIGTGWEFYDKKEDARKRYEELRANPEKYCGSMRPYHHETDKVNLGACHWDLKNSI